MAATVINRSEQEIVPLSDDVVISVRNLGKMYTLYDHPQDRLKQSLFWRMGRNYGRPFWALQDVSFNVRRGETIGIIGRNGSGKSTLLEIIAGILQPTIGEVQVQGRVAALLELGSGFNLEYTGRENIFLNGAILGLSQKEIENKYDEIVSFADIGEFITQPVKEYSSGMSLRLAFAIQACIFPDILIVDEALSVGDVSFQRKCFRRLEELHDRGSCIILVSHDLNAIVNVCSKALLINNGLIVYEGVPTDVCDKYQKLLFGEDARNAALEYGDGSAQFVKVWFENARGESIQTISQSDDILFCYRVKFNKAIQTPVFGLRVRNVQGSVISSTNTYILGQQTGFYNLDDEVSVKWRLSLPVLSGYYFFSCGCSYLDTDRFLCRQVDILKLFIVGRFKNSGLLDTTNLAFLQKDKNDG